MNNNTEIELDEELKELEKELTNNWIMCSVKDMNTWGKLEEHKAKPIKFMEKQRLK